MKEKFTKHNSGYWRRVGTGKHILLADLRNENCVSAEKILNEAGFTVSTTVEDISSSQFNHLFN